MKNNLTTNKKQNVLNKFVMVALMVAFAVAFAATPAVSFVAAGALDTVMDKIIEIISTAALYIGIVIVLWGVFQIVLAFRREDSEGISKQITTVVVGGVLTGFGAVAEGLYTSLKNSNNGGNGGGGNGP